MSQVLITGATGLVGGHLLRLLILDRHISTISPPTRRPLLDITGVYNPHDPQLTDALAQVQDPIDIAFAALAPPDGKRAVKAFVHADYTLVVDTALRRKAGRKTFRWSARTAREPQAAVFTTVKGKMEEALIAQKWERLTIARPSMLMGAP